jgi:hypothetical protein
VIIFLSYIVYRVLSLVCHQPSSRCRRKAIDLTNMFARFNNILLSPFLISFFQHSLFLYPVFYICFLLHYRLSIFLSCVSNPTFFQAPNFSSHFPLFLPFFSYFLLSPNILLSFSGCHLLLSKHPLKGTVSQDLLLLVFYESVSPQPQNIQLGLFRIFFENSVRYSQVKVHRYQRHRRKICHFAYSSHPAHST